MVIFSEKSWKNSLQTLQPYYFKPAWLRAYKLSLEYKKLSIGPGTSCFKHAWLYHISVKRIPTVTTDDCWPMADNANLSEYTMKVLKYYAVLSIDIAGDISWGDGLSGNDHQQSCCSGLGGLKDIPIWHCSCFKTTIYPSINGGWGYGL